MSSTLNLWSGENVITYSLSAVWDPIPTAKCPTCRHPMTRQPRGGLKCGREDCGPKQNEPQGWPYFGPRK